MKRTYTIAALILFAASVMVISGCESKAPPAEQPEQTATESQQPAQVSQPQVSPQPAASAESAIPVTFDHVLNLWQSGQKDAAAAQFLTLNWQSPDVFEKGSVFTISEPQFVKLSENERQQIAQEAVAKTKYIKELSRHVVDQAKALIAENKKDLAMQHYNALMDCSNILSGDNQLKLVQLVGKALPKFIQRELPDLQSP